MFFLIRCCCSVCDLSDLEFFVCFVFEGFGLALFFFYEQCMVAEHCFDVREIVQVFCLSAKKGFLSVPSVGINDGCPCCSRQVFEFEDIPSGRLRGNTHALYQCGFA